MKPKSNAKYNCVSNSNAEPLEIKKNWIESFRWFLPHPSAIFDGIEITARFICDCNPNTSSFGNFEKRVYIIFTNTLASFQTSNSV